MNNTIIDISGIHLNQKAIHMEHSPDTAYLLSIKDEHGTEVIISICHGKITHIEKIK